MHIGIDTDFCCSLEVFQVSARTCCGHHETAMRLALALGWGCTHGDQDGLVRNVNLQSLVLLYPDTNLAFWQAVESTGLIRETEAGLQFEPRGWVWETRRRGG